MMYISMLLYAFSLPLIESLEIQHQLTDDKIQEMFQTTLDKAPYHEIISIEHSINKRSIKELSIKVKMNGIDRELILQSTEGFFAGKDTKVWLTERITANETKFKYTLQSGIMEKVNVTFYHDRISKSAITHTVNKRGISEFNGVIDADNVITPLRNIIRKPRDVFSKSYYESDKGNLANLHVIYKHQIQPVDDGTVTNTILYENSSLHLGKEESELGVPYMVYPEILVFVDKTLFEYFDKDIEKTIAYTLTFWNGADLYFRGMENPKIRLSIAGIVLCQDQIIPVKPFQINSTILKRFGKFLHNKDKFTLEKDYDIAVLMGADKESKGGTAGLSYLSFACLTSYTEENIGIVSSLAIIQDDTKFLGIINAVHELGHLFGSPHDGFESTSHLGGPGSKACPWSEGYILSHEKVNKNQFYFSSCSEEMMKLFFSRKQAECLRNDPAVNRTDEQILRILPGTYMSLDEQCQRFGCLKAFKVTPNICFNITCFSKTIEKNGDIYNRVINFNIPALDGTPCDIGKFCLKGECVEVLHKKSASSHLQTLHHKTLQLLILMVILAYN